MLRRVRVACVAERGSSVQEVSAQSEHIGRKLKQDYTKTVTKNPPKKHLQSKGVSDKRVVF
jgi:hypothetical protein